MKTKIIQIGNSKVLRIPASTLKQLNIDDFADVTVKAGEIIIRPMKEPRAHWREQYQNAIEKHGQKKEIEFLDFKNKFDDEEWTW